METLSSESLQPFQPSTPKSSPLPCLDSTPERLHGSLKSASFPKLPEKFFPEEREDSFQSLQDVPHSILHALTDAISASVLPSELATPPSGTPPSGSSSESVTPSAELVTRSPLAESEEKSAFDPSVPDSVSSKVSKEAKQAESKLVLPSLLYSSPLKSATLPVHPVSHAPPTSHMSDLGVDVLSRSTSFAAEPRARSLSDSWQLWDAVSPLLSPGSWFEREESFPTNPRQRALSNSVACHETRRLVREYDSAKTPTLQQHEQYKHHKWGEDEFCQFDLDTADIDIDLSLADSIKVLPLTDTVAQCVKSYSAFLGRFTPGRSNRPDPRFSQLPPLLEDPSFIESVSPKSECPSHPLPSFDVIDTADSLDFQSTTQSVGELAIPRAVQEVLDFAMLLSRSAGNALGTLSCPKRLPRGAYSSSGVLSDEERPAYSCPRRRKPSRHRNLDLLEGRDDGLQCDVADTLAGCPRRAMTATNCPRRHGKTRRRRKNFADTVSRGFAANGGHEQATK